MNRILALLLAATLGLAIPAAAREGATPAADVSCSLQDGSMVCAVHASSAAGKLYAVVVLQIDPAHLLSLQALKLFEGLLARLGFEGSAIRTAL
jgi:hypothetical protein